jgi:transposase
MTLPPAGTTRWTAWQKAAVIRAIRGGSLSIAEASRHYMLSEEEFVGWQSAFERDGIAGLQLKSMRRRRGAQSVSNG